MQQITCYISGVTRIDEQTALITADIGFILNGVRQNVQNASLGNVGNLLNALLGNAAIRAATANYINANYGTNFVATDVTLFGGIVAV